jgi:intein/homing endonuclease
MKKDISKLGFKSIVGWRGDSLCCPQAFGGDIFAGCSMGCWWCLSGDTLINLPNGLSKPIEELKVGDEVLTYNEKTSQVEVKQIKHTMNRNSNVIRIKVGDKILRITKNHKVYTQRGWVEAGELKKGDKVLVHG